MAGNGISTLATKELRQLAKLNLASVDRQNDGFHTRTVFDISLLPTVYSDNDVVDQPNDGGLVIGRPWIEPSDDLYVIDGYVADGYVSA